jgi:aryl-alcohol dehydrogenase-like predicted oxidoreductase
MARVMTGDNLMPATLDSYRLLGRSGLRVSPLALGTMTFGTGQGWGADDGEAGKIFNTYVERGGNFIDTANFYGQGGSETVLSKLIAGKRNQLVISTKYSLTMRAGDANASGNHRKNMVCAVEDSLKRFQTDYIDLLYLHAWDFCTPAEEILRAFDDLVRAGKILYAGLSDIPAWQASRLQAIADLRGWAPMIALQVQYNLIERTVERDLLPMALEMGMGVLPWSPLAGGILSGKYSRADIGGGAPMKLGSMVSRKAINMATGKLTERALTIAETLGDIAQDMGKTSSQVALAWTMRHKAVVSPLIGARTLAQLEDNLAALDVGFTAGQLEQLDAVSKIELGFPHDLLASPAAAMMFGNVNVARRTP